MKTKYIIIGAVILTIGFMGLTTGGVIVWWITSHRSAQIDYAKLAQMQMQMAQAQPATPGATQVPPAAQAANDLQMNQFKQFKAAPGTGETPEAKIETAASPIDRRNFNARTAFPQQQLRGVRQDDESDDLEEAVNDGRSGPGRAPAGFDERALQAARAQQSMNERAYQVGLALGTLMRLRQAAAMAGTMGGAGGAMGGNNGGDNFWTSRFSAGNYDAQSGSGYVSVPGYGPVGFGPN